jgi:hypothetical protein
MNQITLKHFILAMACLLGTGCTMNVTNKGPEATPSTPAPTAPKEIVIPESNGEGGVINGGGGRGVRCNKDGKETFEVLDLYEARTLYNLDLIDFGTDEDAAKQKLAELLTNHFRTPGQIIPATVKFFKNEMIQKMLDTMKFIESGKTLKLINDSFEPTIEAGCKPVQIAVYHDESILLVDRNIWDQLNVTNKMALLAHEILYFEARRRGVKNSVSTRKLTGLLLSTKGVTRLTEGLSDDKDKSLRCDLLANGIEQGSMYLHVPNPKEPRQIEAIFTRLGGHANFFRTSAILKDISISQIFLPGLSITREADLLRDTYPTNGSILIQFLRIKNWDVQAKLTVVSGGDKSVESTFEVRCRHHDPKSLDPIKIKARRYESKSDKSSSFQIEENGTLTLESENQVGSSRDSSGSATVPYGTICKVRKYGVITEETADRIEYSTASVELLESPNNTEHCARYIEIMNATAATGLSFILELNDYNEVPFRASN